MIYLHEVTTLELDQDKCTGCGVCAEVCPRAVFVIDEKKAWITDGDLCMECGACALNCVPGALSVEAGVGCASALINGMISGGEPVCGCDAGDKRNADCC